MVTKGTLAGMSAAGFLTWRFGIAAVVLALVGLNRIRAMSAADVSHGVLLGIFLAAGFLLQTTGLRDVSAALPGFLTGTMLHLAGLSRWATTVNAYGLTVLSVAVAAGLCACAAIVNGGPGVPPTPSAWWSVLYLAVVATCVGFAVQAWAQSGLSATQAAVVMTLEPVFAAGLAAAVGGERLSAVAIAGGLIVVVSMFIAELGSRKCCDAMSPRVECC